jgi:urate oxidase
MSAAIQPMPVVIQLAQCSYGKTGVRLVKVERDGARHHLRDITVAVQVFGAFEDSYLEGDNRSVLPTDTMKNAVYVLARQQRLKELEAFGTRVADHFLSRHNHLARVRVTLSENIWERILCNGEPHGSAFQKSGTENRIVVIEADRSRKTIQSGIHNLSLLKTSRSSFANFLRDEYTTLKETSDRLFASCMNVEWSYSRDARDFREIRQRIRTILLTEFAGHDSQSVQHTLYAMGRAVLERISAVEEIWLSMPNRHCLPVDLSPFGMDNPNEVFIPIEEPSGEIEARLSRKSPVR